MSFVQGYSQGLAEARNDGRPLLVFFTATWCGYCHQMVKDAFVDPRVVALSERFCCVWVDADAEPHVVRQFNIRGFPTVQFISPQGSPIGRLAGKKTGLQVVQAMEEALRSHARRSAPRMLR